MSQATETEEEPLRKRILVIEDEPDIVRGLRDALQFEGFDVEARGTAGRSLLFETSGPGNSWPPLRAVCGSRA